jgi:hypothetical protein
MGKKFSLSSKANGQVTKKMTSPNHRDKGTSASQNTSTKSGSRPMGSKFPIAVSSPMNPQHLDSRHVKGALGSK